MQYAVRHKTAKALGFHIPAVLLSIIMIYPLIWMIASSLKPNEEVFTTVTSLIPSRVVWENYVTCWQSTGRYTYADYFTNSFTIALWSTVGGVVSSSLVAYAFARIPFAGKKVWFAILMGTMLLPVQVLLIPQYIMFKSFGWINTYLPIIIPQFCGVPFFVFLNLQFMRGIPRELDEAAEIDGCGWLYKYLRIMLPLSVPSLITSGIFGFYWSWQEFLQPLIYISKPRLYPVSIALKMLSDPNTQTNWSGLFAMTTLSIIPVVIVFMVFQRYLVEGVATTGLKG
ncbi:MAG: carbohydrate ABC transporter permease [Clostridia bacterium]|nr:carbohydrate ABC transporter permease [Clostridia bacterium]